ncbi:hypothetical protein L6172_14270 [Thalassospiraceae bacterium SW-3-3]|nr:hypothetical protein L6172_14270 [Thalassospiraceae bacterium SW-3-3]
MYKRYKSDFPNQVHQLIISVSRHYYVTKQGRYNHQKKPFEIQIDDDAFEACEKRHVVNYLVRDHFSGLFYAEVTTSDALIRPVEFLHRAWSPKKNHPLHGLPNAITIPKTVQNRWPRLTAFMEELEIIPLNPTSGFQGGVRDIRTWEDELRTQRYESGYPPLFREVSERSPHIMEWTSEWSRWREKHDRWKDHLPEQMLIPKPLDEFVVDFE